MVRLILEAAGFGSVAAGFFLYHPGAGFIALGLGLIIYSNFSVAVEVEVGRPEGERE